VDPGALCCPAAGVAGRQEGIPMSLYKRKNTWWVRFSVGGRRVHASAGTADRARAQEYHDKLKAELWEAVRLNRRYAHLAAEHLLEHANRIAPNLHQSKIVKLRKSSK